MRHALILLVCLTCLATPHSLTAQTPAEPFDHDGWYSWRVESLSNAPEWCCFTWNAGVSQKTRCKLDDRHGSFGNTFDTPNANDEIQIYALVQDDEIRRLRTLSPNCGVDSDQAWTNLGLVETAQSLNWLTQHTLQPGPAASELMAAIAMHSGEQSLEEMERFAVTGETLQQRREAIFWLGQLRINEAEEILLALITDDTDPQIREHAIFSYAQSPAPDRLDVLVEIVGNTEQPMRDRQSALFWLAQLEDGSGVDFIHDLLLEP